MLRTPNIEKLLTVIIATTVISLLYFCCAAEGYSQAAYFGQTGYGIVVPDDYPSIQLAIYAAVIRQAYSGGTYSVWVKEGGGTGPDGAYEEEIAMMKGVDLLGELGNPPTIIGKVTTADNVELRNFVIENSTESGVVVPSEDVTIMNTVINVTDTGIDLNGANNVLIESNTVHSVNGPCVNSQDSDYTLRNNILTLVDTTLNAIAASTDTPEILYNCILGKISPANLPHMATISAGPSYADAAAGDFHFAVDPHDENKTPSIGLDSGDPESVYSREIQFMNKAIDLGAFGNTPETNVTAGTIRVPDDYPTIYEAISVSTPGTIISLAPGVYEEDRIYLPQGVALMGAGKEVTTVQLNGLVYARSDTTITGITFSDTVLPDEYFSTMLLLNSSNITITDCNFELTNMRSYSSYYGTQMVYICGSNITLERNNFHCTISAESPRMFFKCFRMASCSTVNLRRNSIFVEYTPTDGALYLYGMYCYRAEDIRLENNIIYIKAGSAYRIYGMYCRGPSDNIFLKNNTIVIRNDRTTRAGSYGARNRLYGIISSAPRLELRNNIIGLVVPPCRAYILYPVYISVAASDVADADISLTYNIYNEGRRFRTRYPSELVIDEHDNNKADPQFVDLDVGDLHLQPLSPAIDAGDPNDAYSSEPEPNGGRINCGAYGNTAEATTTQ